MNLVQSEVPWAYLIKWENLEDFTWRWVAFLFEGAVNHMNETH